MNSRYWGETLIKLLKLTNSMYNHDNIGSETGKKVASKLLTVEKKLTGDHVVTQAVWGKGLKAYWHVSTRARKTHWHAIT